MGMYIVLTWWQVCRILCLTTIRKCWNRGKFFHLATETGPEEAEYSRWNGSSTCHHHPHRSPKRFLEPETHTSIQDQDQWLVSLPFQYFLLQCWKANFLCLEMFHQCYKRNPEKHCGQMYFYVWYGYLHFVKEKLVPYAVVSDDAPFHLCMFPFNSKVQEPFLEWSLGPTLNLKEWREGQLNNEMSVYRLKSISGSFTRLDID